MNYGPKCKYKNTKFLKDVIGESLDDLRFDNDVFHKYNTKSKSTIYERKKMYSKLRIFVLQNFTFHRMERQDTE